MSATFQQIVQHSLGKKKQVGNMSKDYSPKCLRQRTFSGGDVSTTKSENISETGTSNGVFSSHDDRGKHITSGTHSRLRHLIHFK